MRKLASPFGHNLRALVLTCVLVEIKFARSQHKSTSISLKLNCSARINKEIKNASECIVELYISTRGFLRTREKCIEKHEAQPSASRTSRVFLKIPKCLYNSTMHEDEVFYFFYKMLRK